MFAIHSLNLNYLELPLMASSPCLTLLALSNSEDGFIDVGAIEPIAPCML